MTAGTDGSSEYRREAERRAHNWDCIENLRVMVSGTDLAERVGNSVGGDR